MRFLLFTVFLLAGCTAPVDDVVVETETYLADGNPAPLHLHYEDCIEFMGILPTPPEMVEYAVPHGFEWAPFDATGTMATVLAFGYTCTYDGQEVQEFSGSLAVIPSAAYEAEPEPFAYAVNLGTYTSKELAEVYNAWHFDQVYAGDVSVEQWAGAAEVGHVTGTGEMGDFRLTSEVPSRWSAAPADYARVFAVKDRHVVGAMDYAWTAGTVSAAGTAQLVFEQLPPVTQPGLAFHWAGDDYGYLVSFVPLPEHQS